MDKNTLIWTVIILSVVLFFGVGIYLYSVQTQNGAPVAPTAPGALDGEQQVDDPDLVDEPTETDPNVNTSTNQTISDPDYVAPEESDSGDVKIAGVSVSISNFAYSPETITVKKGTRVTWTNQDNVGHTVTAYTEGPDSPLLRKGETFSYTFNSVGTFDYYCVPHPWMKASVVVTD